MSEEKKTCLSENAVKVLEKRYLKRDCYGNPTETPNEMFKRVADTIAKGNEFFGADEKSINELSKEFYDAISNCRFMPNSPTLMNAGRELGQLAACFVLPIEDTLKDIFETIKNTALIHQSGGGTGFSFSRLRPKNDVVRSTMGVSSGPVSFMEVFNAATEAVKQGGTRRGANMGILRVDHPDILEFIDCKSDNTRLNNFNISVALTDKFMDACLNNEDYELIHPNTKQSAGRLSAKKVFDKIVDNAWKNGEPGIIFIDTINRDNPTPQTGEIEATNPCGEVPLLPYEACNLGSINLSRMVKTNSNGVCTVDWDLLSKTVKTAIKFLDNVITVNNYPLSQIKETVNNNRKIGLGVMGWADMLMKLGISYASADGVTLGMQIMEFIDYVSKCESVELSKKRGAFPNFKGSIYENGNYFSKKYLEQGEYGGKCGSKHESKITDEMLRKLDSDIKKYGIRNATTTCIAPTGTISMIAGASGGIEPLFGLVFSRLILDGTEMLEVNPVFKDCMIKNGLYSEELMHKISLDGSIAHIDEIPEDIKRVFVTAHDIPPYWHIKMQAAFQLHTDNAVSKTVNFVESATREDIKEVYISAYKNRLKGITVYRNNSRTFQPMNLKQPDKTADLAKDTSDLHQNVLQNESDDYAPTGEIKTVVCPECGNKIKMAEGCFICLNCGYSGCT